MMLLGCALYAGPVTPEKALQVAQSVFASAPGTKAAGESELKIIWDGEFEPATKAAQDPAFYVISRSEGGFVMVAGNDNVQPVLAFSFENNFIVEGMPDNVRWWMQQYKDHVRSSVSATPAVREQWGKYDGTKAAPATPVTDGLTDVFEDSFTNEWDQTNPANFYCPNVEDQEETSVCGCVALATAEIMAWFGTNNPAELAAFEIPGYEYDSENSKHVTIQKHNLRTTPLWSGLKALKTSAQFYGEIVGYSTAPAAERHNKLYYGYQKPIPGSIATNSLTELGRSLANLTYDIGTLLQAHYNDGVEPHTGTAAVTEYVVSAVAPVFGYNNGARFITKDSYTKAQWELLMKDQITQHPIIYTGPGHAYVADGYGTFESKQYFHFNMGWGGHNNGYYTLDIQEKYADKHNAIIDFFPNPDHSEARPVIGFTQGSEKKGGFSCLDGYYSKKLTFDLMYSQNKGSAVFTGEFALFVVNQNGTRGESPSAQANVPGLPIGSYYPAITFNDVNVPSASFGDQLVAYYKESGKDTYYPFIFAPLDVSLPALPFFPAAAIKKKASYHKGDYFEFALTNHSYTYENSTWKVTDPSGKTTSYVLDDYRVQLNSAGEYKISCTTPEQETVVTYINVIE